jgi:putative ABC transport system substrate-binding protein
MIRVAAVGAVAALLVAAPPSPAPPATRPARVGVLGQPDSPDIRTFRQALGELGWVEGQNVAFEYGWAEGPLRPALAAELVRAQVDVILAPGTVAVAAARKASRQTPIVFATVSDAVGPGFVERLARPGGNVTGTTTMNRELHGKRLELLLRVAPQASRVAVLGSPADPSNAAGLAAMQQVASAMSVTLQPFAVRSRRDVEAAFAAMRAQRTAALVVQSSALMSPLYAQVVALARRARIAAMYSSRPPVDAGGLMCYGASFREQHRRAAVFVDKILRGASPAELPVEQPAVFELVVNLRSARATGLTLPAALVALADEVIR